MTAQYKMARNTSFRAGSTNSGSLPGYVEGFLSVFNQPLRLQSRKDVTSETLLRETPILGRSNQIEMTGDPWSWGFFQGIPYSAALSLLVVLLRATADGIIVWKSDGQEIDKWKVSTSILLAILSAVANVSLQTHEYRGM